MLKSVLYCLIFVITTVRLADITYLLATRKTSLPVFVIGTAAVMILYGLFLMAKKFFGNVTLKQMMAFFAVQTVVIAFNLTYVSITSPLKISAAETLLVGTFLDILVNCCVIYFCMKQIRNHYFAVAQPVASTNRRV